MSKVSILIPEEQKGTGRRIFIIVESSWSYCLTDFISIKPNKCMASQSSKNESAKKTNKKQNKTVPVTLLNSSRIFSFVLFFGIDPTKSLLFATEMHTPMCLPERISWLSH